MATLSTIMPPVVETFQPAFLNNGNMKVYFSPSSFNSFSSGWKLHVSVRRQSNNENIIRTDINPHGIIVYNFTEVNYSYDYEKKMYFIIIEKDNTIFNNAEWAINEYYKVQLRFDSYDNSYPDNIYEKVNYMNNNTDYFSEWSSITLCKSISQPIITINQLPAGEAAIVNWGTLHLTGNLNFASAKETERLQSYYVQVLSHYEKTVLFTSEMLFPTDNIASVNNFYEINYLLNLQSIINEKIAILGGYYSFKLFYETNSGYQGEYETDFKIELTNNEKFAQTHFSINVDNETGCISLDIQNEEELAGLLYVRRTSSLSQYKTWELVGTYLIEGELDIHIDDYSVQNLTWYKYTIQFESISKESSQIIFAPHLPKGGLLTETPFFVHFDNSFLYRDNKQLSILPDMKVSGYKVNITRTKTDTLGGKYPLFTENGNLNYKQLTITGKITSEFDVYRRFLDEKTYFGNKAYQDYLEYKKDEGILDINKNDYLHCTVGNPYPDLEYEELLVSADDVLWEREFREAVSTWINDGKPKLLRTETEGNILVLLSDFSMSPIGSLGRRLYDFSVTAYEIGDGNSLADLQHNKVVPFQNDDFANLDPEVPIFIQETDAGQQNIENMTLTSGTVSTIKNYYSLKETVQSYLDKYYAGILDGNFAAHICFTKVKLIFTKMNGLSGENDPNPDLLIYPDSENGNYVGNEPMKIFLRDKVLHQQSNEGIDYSVYQLPSNMHVDDVKIYRKSDDEHITGVIEYVVSYKRVLGDVSEVVTTSIIDRVVGQISGAYEWGQSIAPIINNKYYYIYQKKKERVEYKVEAWRGIKICGPVMTKVKLVFKNELPSLTKKKNTKELYCMIGYDGLLNLTPRSIVTTYDGEKYVIPEAYDFTDIQFIKQSEITPSVTATIDYFADIIKKERHNA